MKNISRESCKKTICSLALNGESTQYDLCPLTGLNYASVHEAIKDLVASGLIKETRQEKGPGPLPKRFFSLTLRGLAMAFVTTELKARGFAAVNKVAEKWGVLLPLVLGKWEYFKSVELGEEFMRAFKWVIKWILELGYDREEWATEKFWFFIFQMTAGAAKAKWLKALRMDPELRQWAIEGLKEWLAEGRMFMKMHEKSLQVLEMASEPDWSKVVSDLRCLVPPEYKSTVKF